MFLTNNNATIYNLILYSKGIHYKRTLDFGKHPSSWDSPKYHNIKPFGNINREFSLNKKHITGTN